MDGSWSVEAWDWPWVGVEISWEGGKGCWRVNKQQIVIINWSKSEEIWVENNSLVDCNNCDNNINGYEACSVGFTGDWRGICWGKDHKCLTITLISSIIWYEEPEDNWKAIKHRHENVANKVESVWWWCWAGVGSMVENNDCCGWEEVVCEESCEGKICCDCWFCWEAWRWWEWWDDWLVEEQERAINWDQVWSKSSINWCHKGCS